MSRLGEGGSFDSIGKQIHPADQASAFSEAGRRFCSMFMMAGTSGSAATVVRMVAEPILAVSHQTRANCTIAEPTSEKACPPQMVNNR